jgi:hypothetical protein
LAFSFAMNVLSHAEREELETESRTYLEEKYSEELASKYRGFLAFGDHGLEPRANASFYMVARWTGIGYRPVHECPATTGH